MIKMIVSEDMLKPEVGTEGSAGYDLKIASDIRIRPGQVVKVGTGLRVEIPKGHFGMVVPRSSTKSLSLYNTVGIIDSDYQGEITLKIQNNSNTEAAHFKGDRLFQLVILPYFQDKILYVDKFDKTTDRGEGGFGSTDI